VVQQALDMVEQVALREMQGQMLRAHLQLLGQSTPLALSYTLVAVAVDGALRVVTLHLVTDLALVALLYSIVRAIPLAIAAQFMGQHNDRY
jgi:hypothetical protein